MKLYNTLTHKVEEFIPFEEGVVRMYTCGPTVYHYQHIGNIRTYINEDLFEKTFKFLGYDVKRVMNITDVGHLVSDSDTGEDKMVKAMEREHKSSKEIADFYTSEFKKDCELVNIKWPDKVIKATDEIDTYIEIITELLNKDIAYIKNGNVYFDTSKYPKYYELSGKKQDDLMEASRDDVEVDENKRNSADFVLWFTNSKFGNQELQWDSPWGRGFPGWHIECSGIAIKHLGKHLDIHFGAEDAVFPHHTNEIAQSEGYLGDKWCNYWVHLSWLLTNNVKMSKSLGHVLTVSKLKEEGYDPLAFRFMCVSSYYHKQLNFSFELLDNAQNAYKKLKSKILSLNENTNIDEEVYNDYLNKFKNELENDLNTSNTLTLIYDLLKENTSDNTKLSLIKEFDKVLSLDLTKKDKICINDDYINEMINKRNEAKKNKDFALADSIRESLLEEGILLKDTREGTIYEVK